MPLDSDTVNNICQMASWFLQWHSEHKFMIYNRSTALLRTIAFQSTAVPRRAPWFHDFENWSTALLKARRGLAVITEQLTKRALFSPRKPQASTYTRLKTSVLWGMRALRKRKFTNLIHEITCPESFSISHATKQTTPHSSNLQSFPIIVLLARVLQPPLE